MNMNKSTFKKFAARFLSASLIVMLVVAGLPVRPVAAASAGPNIAGTGTDNNAVGSVTWTNPNNITNSAGNQYATANVGASAITHYLQGTDFKFSIPTDATINGISVTIRRQYSGGGGGGAQIRDSGIYLLKTGAVVGNNLANTGSNWPNSMGNATYGGTSNLWGTTWTPEEINATDFGVVLSAVNGNASSRTASVDYMQITITYTAAPGPATKLVITSTAKTTVAGVASTDITVQRQDVNSTPNTTDATITLTLSSDSTGTVTFNPPSPQITSGSSSVTFTYTDTLAGSHTITAASSGLTSATQAENVTAASPNKLAMKTEPSSSVPAGSLFPVPPAVNVLDTYGNVVTSDNSTVVTAEVLTGTGPLLGTLTAKASVGVATFGALAAPATPQTNLTLRFTATGLTSVDDPTVITVTAATVTRLVITGTGTQTAGTNQNLTITAKNDSGTTITSYTGTKSLTFSGANSSTNPVTAPRVRSNTGTWVNFGTATSINFTNGVATVSGSNNGVMTLYKAETALVCVTDGTISSAVSDCLSVVVSPATANKLAFTSAAITTPASVASSNITVEREDAWGNPNTADVARTVTLASNTTGTATFNPVSPIIIAQGTSSFIFKYTDSMAGTPTITAASTVPNTITSATQQETITGGTPTVATSAATAIRRTGATLNGTVNAGGSSMTVTFEYGTTTAYGSTITATQSPVTGGIATAVSAQIPGLLTPGTTYHFRVDGVSGSTTLNGADMTFTTTGAGSITYYVDNTNIAASDANAGNTPALPFKTLSHGATVADAGDTVSVLAGTYAETVKPINNGGAGMPLTFVAAPGVTVTGEAANSTNGGAFRLYSKGYIVIDGFTITGTADYGIITTASNHITIQNNHVSYSGSTTYLRPGIYLTATTDSSVIGNTTDHNTFDGIRLNNGSNNNWIEKNTSFGNATQISSQATGINLLKNSNYNTIIRNITYSNEDSGINFYTGSSHNLAINNLSYGNGDHGIDNNAAPYQTIIGNTVHGNVTTGINAEQDTSGNGSGGATIINNISVDNGYLQVVGGGAYTGHQPGNIRVDTTSTTSPAATTLDYNLVYSSSSAHLVLYIWGSTSYTSLFAFQAANSQDMHGLQANPLLKAPAPIQTAPITAPFNVAINTGDYHILTGSPAIDSANSGDPSEQTVDIEGNPRVDDPATANTGVGTRTYDDRGAYEFQQLLPAQTITVTGPTPFPTSAVYDTFFTVTATGGASGNPVTIAGSGSCSGSGNNSALITMTSGIGTCTVTLDQAGNTAYSPAPTVTMTVTAEKASQTITITAPVPFPAFAGINSILTVTATGGDSGNPVSIAATGSCSGGGASGSALITMAGTIGECTINFNQNGNDNFAAATLSKIISVIETLQSYLPLIVR
jgi:parallel beta-helix repeat protein